MRMEKKAELFDNLSVWAGTSEYKRLNIFKQLAPIQIEINVQFFCVFSLLFPLN